MMTTTTTEPPYPPLPTLEPRRADEPAQHYGLRALRFAVATECTATMDDEALTLATHVYRLAIARPDSLQTTIDRLAETDRQINAAIRRRAAARDRALEAIDAPASGAGIDKPNAGPMAPLATHPKTEPPAPSFAQLAPSVPQRADFAF